VWQLAESADTSTFMSGWVKGSAGTFTDDGTFYILNGSDLGSNTRVFAYIEKTCGYVGGCDLSLTWSWATTDCSACDPVVIRIGGVETQLVTNGVTSIAMNTTTHIAEQGNVIQFGIDSLQDDHGPSILTIANIVLAEIPIPSASPTVSPTSEPPPAGLGAGPIAGIVIGSLVVAFGCVVGGYYFYTSYGDRVSQYLKAKSVEPEQPRKANQISVQSKPQPAGLNFVVVDDSVVHPERKPTPAPPARPNFIPVEEAPKHTYPTKPINFVVLDEKAIKPKQPPASSPAAAAPIADVLTDV
jgi:hypothetical protein